MRAFVVVGVLAFATPVTVEAAPPEPSPGVPEGEDGSVWFERSGDPPLQTTMRREDRSPGCTFNGSNYWNGTSGNDGGAIARSTIVQRAASWIDRAGTEWCASRPFPNEYGTYPSTHHGRYRVDCSGFVSMAWGLEHSYNTSSLPSISRRLASIGALRPGDILVRPGHAMVFVRWADANTLVLQQESSQPQRAAELRRTRGDLDPRYVPYRYEGVVDTPAVWAFTVDHRGTTSSSNVTLRPRGGWVTLDVLATDARSARFGASPSFGGLPTKVRVSKSGHAVLVVKVPANTTSTVQRYTLRTRVQGLAGAAWSSRHPTITVPASA